MTNEKVNYGIDAPPVIRNLLAVALGLVAVSLLFPTPRILGHEIPLGDSLQWMSIWFFLSAALMVLYAKFGKFRHRDRILDRVKWRGDEQVLDVGTGRGLLAIGAAKRVPDGGVVGIDIWQTADLSGNSPESTERNVRLEGVASRVGLKSEDVRKMSFPSETFDVIVSNLCLHNIPDAKGRTQACQEIARVLKVGGVALISDFQKTAEYTRAFRDCGLTVRKTGPYFLDVFPPLKILEIRKNR